jgi:hypothetical protein
VQWVHAAPKQLLNHTNVQVQVGTQGLCSSSVRSPQGLCSSSMRSTRRATRRANPVLVRAEGDGTATLAEEKKGIEIDVSKIPPLVGEIGTQFWEAQVTRTRIHTHTHTHTHTCTHTYARMHVCTCTHTHTHTHTHTYTHTHNTHTHT